MRTAIFFLGISVLLQGALFGDEPNAETEEIRSLLSGYISNLEAVANYDVLMDFDSQWVGNNGAILENKSLERLIVSSETKKCVSVRKLTRIQYEKSERGAVEKKDDAIRVAFSDGKKAFGRDFPAKAFPLKETKVTSVLRSNDSTMIHALGICQFPFSFRVSSSLQKHIDYLRYGDVEMESASGLKGSPAIRIVMPYPNGLVETKTMVFDEHMLVPITLRKTALSKGKTYPSFLEHLKYQDFDGVYLPTKIEGERRKSEVFDDTRVFGVKTYDVTLTWLGVNTEIDDELFSHNVIRDANAALSLLKVEESDDERSVK